MKPTTAALTTKILVITLIAAGSNARGEQTLCDYNKCSSDPNKTTMPPAPAHGNNAQKQDEDCEVRTTILDGNIKICL